VELAPIAMGMALGAFLAGLLLTFLFSIISGRIKLRGLMSEPLSGKPAPISRPQMIVSALVAIGSYAATAITDLGLRHDLPDAPLWLISTFVGSNVVYLGARTFAAILTNLQSGR